MGYELVGKVIRIMDTKQVSDRFSKREFVLETNDNPRYPQTLLCQATGDRIAQLDGVEDGDELRVAFNLRGREWRSPSGEVKYFTTIEAWKIEPVGDRKAKTSSGTPHVAPPESPPSGVDDDIPF